MLSLYRLSGLFLWYYCYATFSRAGWMPVEELALHVLAAFGVYLLGVMVLRGRVQKNLQALYAEYTHQFGAPPDFYPAAFGEPFAQIGQGAELAGMANGELIGGVVSVLAVELKRAWDRRGMSAEQLALYKRLEQLQGLYNRMHPLVQTLWMGLVVGLTWGVMNFL